MMIRSANHGESKCWNIGFFISEIHRLWVFSCWRYGSMASINLTIDSTLWSEFRPKSKNWGGRF